MMSKQANVKKQSSVPQGAIQRGFTLIELMMVVAIIGLIAAIAIPSYLDSVTRSRRSEAKAELMDLAARQERFFSSRQPPTYTTDIDTAAGLNVGRTNSEHGFYAMTAAAGPTGIATSFVLTATPIGAQAGDAECGVMTLDSLGVKTHAGTAPTLDFCWAR